MTNPLPEDNPENLSEALPTDAEAVPTETAPVESRSIASEMLALHMQGRRGANWFYWVAGLSLVNSAVILGGGSISLSLVLASHSWQIAWQRPFLNIILRLFG